MFLGIDFLSVRGSVAVKRLHGHSISSQGNHLIGELYIFSGLVHYHLGVTRWRAGRHDAEEVADAKM